MTPLGLERLTYLSGDVELAVDVHRPRAEPQRCAVLILHGGAWRAGSKDIVATRAAALAEHGFVCLAANYRLLSEAAWPAQLDDVAAALNWVRQSAERLDVDPGFTVVQGHSAGAHLALLADAFEPEIRPAAICAYYPPAGFRQVVSSSMDTPPHRSDPAGRLPSTMLLESNASADQLRAASPVDIVTTSFPPTILFHGGADAAIDMTASFTLHQRLSESGVRCELHVYGDLNHEFDRAPGMTDATAKATACTLERMVSRREQWDDEARRFPFPPRPDESAQHRADPVS